MMLDFHVGLMRLGFHTSSLSPIQKWGVWVGDKGVQVRNGGVREFLPLL